MTVDCPLVGREHAWDARRREGGLVELIDASVVLVKSFDFSRLDIEGRDGDLAMELVPVRADVLQEIQKRPIVKEASLGN